MKTILNTLRYDLQRLRWVLLPWLGIQLWWIFVSLPSLELDPSRVETKYSAYVIMVHIGWFGILTFLSFTHAPSDSRAGWRTRPLRGSIVGLEKLCLGFLLLVIIPTVSSLALSPYQESQSTNALVPPWISVLSIYSTAFLSTFFVASLVKNIRRFFGFGAVLITPCLIIWIAARGQLFHSGTTLGIGLTATFFIILLSTIGFASLIVAQYH